MARLWAKPLLGLKRGLCASTKLLTNYVHVCNPRRSSAVYTSRPVYRRPRSQSYAATECLFPRIFIVGPTWTSLSKKTTTELVVFPSLLDLPRSQRASNTFPHLRASSIAAAMGCWQLIPCTTSALWLMALPVGLVTAGGAAGVTVEIGRAHV